MLKLSFCRYWYLFFVVFIPFLLRAQSIIDSSFLKCQYTFEFPGRTGKQVDLIVLEVGTKVSKSYSYYTWQCDSANMTSEGRAAKKQVLHAFAKNYSAGNHQVTPGYYRRSGWFVYKGLPAGMITVTDNISLQYFRYAEQQNTPEWQSENDTCRIMNYLCYKAKTAWRGRRWIAWFTQDIPVGEGPWKLCGLPGLILKAESEDGIYCFTAVEVRSVDEPLIFETPYDVVFHKISRLKFLRMQRKYEEDNGFYNIVTLGDDMGFLESTPTKITYDLMECDYR